MRSRALAKQMRTDLTVLPTVAVGSSTAHQVLGETASSLEPTSQLVHAMAGFGGSGDAAEQHLMARSRLANNFLASAREGVSFTTCLSDPATPAPWHPAT